VAAIKALAAPAAIIKPYDTVRVRSTLRAAIVLEILCGHRRRLKDVATGAIFIAHVDDLHLVQVSVPRRWPSHITT
jgi:hypothetical protein